MEKTTKAMTNEQLLGVIMHGCDEDLPRRVTSYLATSTNRPTMTELMRIRGIGKVKAQQLMAVMELSARYLVGTEAQTIESPEDILPRLSWLKYEKQEHMVVITLDSSNHVLGVHEMTVGLVNQTPVHSREAFTKAIEDNAVSIMLAHNHPSGSSKPSPEDMAITRVICASGKILQIPVLDHIIISKSGYHSICRTNSDIFEKTFEL